MASIFTEHVREFGPQADPSGRVLPELERLLRRRLRRRNLLAATPTYLGYNHPSWEVEGAFEDLVHDCYLFAFAQRIVGLRNQLARRDSIDGLIVRNVDQFLLERQRRHDPVGYAVFGNVAGAARLLE